MVDATLGMFFKHNNFKLSGRLRDGKANVGILSYFVQFKFFLIFLIQIFVCVGIHNIICN